jgi:prophage maintenance system killer protein
MGRPSKSWQPKTEVVRFSLKQAVEIYREFREEFCKDQPLPRVEEISQDGLNRLDGCLGNIRQQPKERGYLYKPGIEAAAAYFYFVNKSHWLLNGNKRSAIILTLVYLKAHNKWLRMNWIELYELAKRVAKYKGKTREMLREIKNLFQESLIDYREGIIQKLMVSWDKWREAQ